MRKLIFIGLVALGALVGLISAAKDDWATRAVIMGIGALFGAPIGAAFASIGRKKGRPVEWDEAPHPGMGLPMPSLTNTCLSQTNWADYFFFSKSFTASFTLSTVAPASLATCLPDCLSSDLLDASVPSSVLTISAFESKPARLVSTLDRIWAPPV